MSLLEHAQNRERCTCKKIYAEGFALQCFHYSSDYDNLSDMIMTSVLKMNSKLTHIPSSIFTLNYYY